MSSVAKGSPWYFGMKVSAGVDKDSGTAHTLVMTTARMHNSACALLHGDEQEVSGDKGYDSHQLRTALERLTCCTAQRIYGSFSAVEKKRRRRQNKKWGGASHCGAYLACRHMPIRLSENTR